MCIRWWGGGGVGGRSQCQYEGVVVVLVQRRGIFLCTCVEGKILGPLCRGHGEIPESNCIGVGRYMGPRLGRVGIYQGPCDMVIGGRGGG